MWFKYLQIKKMEHNKTFESEHTFLTRFHQLFLKSKYLHSVSAHRSSVGSFKYEKKKRGSYLSLSAVHYFMFFMQTRVTAMFTLNGNLHSVHNLSKIGSPS